MTALRERIADPSFGAWVSSDPLSCEIMGWAGYDWLILETQHRNVAPDGVPGALQPAELGRSPCWFAWAAGSPSKLRVLWISAPHGWSCRSSIPHRKHSW